MGCSVGVGVYVAVQVVVGVGVLVNVGVSEGTNVAVGGGNLVEIAWIVLEGTGLPVFPVAHAAGRAIIHNKNSKNGVLFMGITNKKLLIKPYLDRERRSFPYIHPTAKLTSV